MGGVELSPGKGLDAIVSHSLEESGQHILRVEVGYASNDGSVKTLRKFYRFHVSNPLAVTEATFRSSNASCFVSISLSNNGEAMRGGLTICEAEFEASSALSAEQISRGVQSYETERPSGARIFDASGRLEVRQTLRYLFKVFRRSDAGTKVFAAGDELGKFRFRWRKACGELGIMCSKSIHCPPLVPTFDPQDVSATMEGTALPSVVPSQGKSGLSLDAATSLSAIMVNPVIESALGQLLSVTMEPIDPPQRAELGVPFKVHFSVTNHSERDMALQLQFNLDYMNGITVCGSSFMNLQDLESQGGSTAVFVSFLPLATGLLKLTGCNIVDLERGQSFSQPPLAQIFVYEPTLDHLGPKT